MNYNQPMNKSNPLLVTTSVGMEERMSGMPMMQPHQYSFHYAQPPPETSSIVESLSRSNPKISSSSSLEQSNSSTPTTKHQHFKTLKVGDALIYMSMIKSKFEDGSPVYDQFIKIMQDYKAKTIDTNCVINLIKRLFKGFPELILSFNSFLPFGYKIDSLLLPEDESQLGSKTKQTFDSAQYSSSIDLGTVGPSILIN
ncbi:hypothetical protein HZS_7882 [Henneguya salminicola]|nr:hypothetical protein HZS_7882 [Henneguya salminicola]